MFCPECGEKSESGDIYCHACGFKIESANTKKAGKKVKKSGKKRENKEKSANDENIEFEIDIPSAMGSNAVRFTNDEMSYKGVSIKYKDLAGISCKQVYQSVNFIPTHQDFGFTFSTDDKRINLSFGTTLHIGAKDRKEIFARLYYLSHEFFVPIIARKLISSMIDDNETIEIGGVYFNRNGFYKKKLFGLGGDEWVHWSDNIGEPGMESGSIILFKSKGNKYQHFKSISIDTENAIVVPDLIRAMFALNNTGS